jgi:hypothetical protein
MRKTIVPIALAMLATAAAAQDVRQEDRREDRQADRLAERQMEANELEVKLAVPRNADGTINETQLVNDVKARIAAGATEIQVRGLTAQDVSALLASNQNLLVDLAKLLPNDGIERQVRLRGAIDARVQRNNEGELRARIEGIDFGTLTPAQRADLARQLATQAGVDRLRIRGVDATGARVRLEVRDGIVRADTGGGRNAERVDRVARVDADDRRGRRGGADRPERAERAERAERVERPERAERAERVERVERVERPDRSGRH